MKPAGFEQDLVVKTDSESLAKWQMGSISLGSAQRHGLMAVEGPKHLQRELASWAAQHQFAGIKPGRRARVAAPPRSYPVGGWWSAAGASPACWGVALAMALGRHIGVDIGAKMLSPFALADPAALHVLLVAAGFSDVARRGGRHAAMIC